MSVSKYDFQMLEEISLLDVALTRKKAADDDAAFKSVHDCAECAAQYLEKYNDDGIVKNHKDFLDDMNLFKESLNKLYASTLVWELDELVKAFMAGDRELMQEKYENLKIGVEILADKIKCAECDENGALKTAPKKKEAEDPELALQPECGKTVSGNYVSSEIVNKIAALVDELEFDDAAELAKKLSGIYYNEEFNIEVKKLIWVMRMGEFEKAGDSANRIIELALKHNKIVDENAEVVKPRVLVVDDVADILLTVKGILCDYCHVCTVTNYVSALRFLENCHADLMLLDIALPEVNGFELLAKIRKIERYKDTPVMFLTGDVSKETILRAIDVGISDYLRKPIDAELLISRVTKRLIS